MLKNLSHLVGMDSSEEILYDTNFGYIFDYLCHCDSHLLPQSFQTVQNLIELGTMMADQGSTADPQTNSNSTIPSVYTYLGQFIDHDITARTDRDSAFNDISDPNTIVPKNPDKVVQKLRNGRRPQLDLDSVFGEGPSFNSKYSAEADHLFNNTSLKMFLKDSPAGYLDLNRKSKKAIIADERNDENLIVGQIHATFIKLFNKISDILEPGLTNEATYSRARQLTKWCYQYIVVNDYLVNVCDKAVVEEILRNGPYFYDTSIPFMPLEFSVAGFRFGHSMIRPFYQINDSVEKTIMELLGPNMGGLLDSGTGQLAAGNVIKWSHFSKFNTNNPTNLARKIDPFIAKGLFDLSPIGTTPPPSVLASLTQRNLLRGYLLSIPVGQSIAKAMRIEPMSTSELVEGLGNSEKQFMKDSNFDEKTPLWYYILQEAKVQQNGDRLGYVGSKLVAETLIGLVKGDFNSYYNSSKDDAVTAQGIRVPNRTEPISSMAALFEYAEVSI